MLRTKHLSHPDNAILNWQSRHVNVWTDASGNFRPIKPKHEDHRKIDGIVASVMALNEALTSEASPSGSAIIF